jgi:hypothetical protein
MSTVPVSPQNQYRRIVRGHFGNPQQCFFQRCRRPNDLFEHRPAIDFLAQDQVLTFEWNAASECFPYDCPILRNILLVRKAPGKPQKRQFRRTHLQVIEHQTIRIESMTKSQKTREQDPAARELSFLERLGLLVDQQWNWLDNQALARRLKNAKLRTNGCVEEIDYRGARGLEKSVIRALEQESAWVGQPALARASWLALAQKPVATGTLPSTPTPRRDSATERWARADGSLPVSSRGLAASTFW